MRPAGHRRELPFADDEAIDTRYPGYPIAEVGADGSSVITKQADSGGAVNIGTITAQILYEIAEPAYANPDVVARFDTIELTADGADRVGVRGVRGEPPSGRLKVALNYQGGWRNTMSVVLTGLDQDRKADRAAAMLRTCLGGWEQFDAVDIRRVGSELRFSVKASDRSTVGRQFSNRVMELLLGSYAGAYATTPPTDAHEYGVYWPTTIDAALVDHVAILPDGTRVSIRTERPAAPVAIPGPTLPEPWEPRPTVRAPLGAVCGARSGDKGGNANVGVWTRSANDYRWLSSELTMTRLKQLLPETEPFEVRRFDLPNLLALNFVIVGLLGEGVASSTRPDPQAKSLGEELRATILDVPVSLLR